MERRFNYICIGPHRVSAIDDVTVEKVFVIKELRGDGTEANPVRIVERYYKMDGTQIAEIDSLARDSGSSGGDGFHEDPVCSGINQVL